MANIVQQTSKTNHVNHSSFDLSGNINLTATTGMLLPVRVDDCLPNSHYTFNTAVFARTVQMVVPSFARVKAHLDTFFVPYRLLGTDYKDIIVSNERGQLNNYSSDGSFSNNGNTLPFLTLSDFFVPAAHANEHGSWDFGSLSDAAGVSYNVTTPILLNMLGYGIPSLPSSNANAVYTTASNMAANGAVASLAATDIVNKVKRNTLFLQAYQKIYQDYYRNQLWEKENRQSYFVPSSLDSSSLNDVAKTSGLLEMRYHDYDKDRIIGMIPDENNILSDGISQYASTVLAGSTGFDSDSVFGNSSVPTSNPHLVNRNGSVNSSQTLHTVNAADQSFAVVNGNVQFPSMAGNPNLIQQYTAISNRRMEAMQRFAEITMLNKSDYKHQISAHFGFTPSDLESDYCRFLGGIDIPLQISDVENTNGTASDSPSNLLGYLGGKGVMSSNGKTISYDVTEHGCIMHILYIVPQIDWGNEFVDRATLRFSRFDFAIPEFDKFGFEPVRQIDINGEVTKVNYGNVQLGSVIGWLPRYWSYKTRLDINQTGFSDSTGTQLNFDSYVVKYNKDRIYNNYGTHTMYKAFKSLPTDLNGLFPVSWSSPTDNPFIISLYIGCKASLPLSIDSLPV